MKKHWSDTNPYSYKNIHQNGSPTQAAPSNRIFEERQAEIECLKKLGYSIKIIDGTAYAYNENGGYMLWDI